MPDQDSAPPRSLTLSPWRVWTTPVLLSLFLLLVSRTNYLLFHSLAELFAIMIGILFFVVGWNAFRFSRNHFLMFLGCGYFWIALLDALHALNYKGMQIVPVISANPATQLWIAARYAEALLLLAAPIFLRKALRRRPAFALMGVIAVTLAYLIHAGLFPDCFREGSGLTPFKVGSEYLIITLLVGALGFLWSSRERLDRQTLSLMALSILFTIGAELSFTFYISVYGFSNLTGHMLKLFSFWMIYLAVVQTTLEEPFRIMARGSGAYDAAPFPTLLIGLDGTIFQSNRAAQEVTGLSESALAGRSCHALFHPSELPEENCPVCRALGDQKPHHDLELDLGSNSGWRQYAVTPVGGNPGPVTGMVHMSRDITQRKLAEEALNEARQNLEEKVARRTADLKRANQQLLEEAQVRRKAEEATKSAMERLAKAQEIARLGNWNWDIEKGDISWSDEIFRIFGYQPQEFVPSYRVLIDAVHPDDQEKVSQAVRVALENPDRNYQVEHRIVRPNGDIRTVMEEGAVDRDQEGQAVRMLGTVQDITLRKRREDELQQAKRDAERANRAKSAFLATMSHEIRTPMSAIIGSIELLEDSPLTPEQREELSVINDSGHGLLELINDILDLAKVEAGELSVEQAEFHLGECVESVRRIMRHPAQQKGLELACRVEPSAPRLIRGDAKRLRQVLINLVGNAVKFTEQGRIDIHVTTHNEAEGPGEEPFLLFTVADTGIGIPQENLNTIFDPFTQVEEVSYARTHTGAGLGLSICRSMVTLMGGRIWLESTLGAGTIFHFTLPRLSVETESDPLPGESAPSPLAAEDEVLAAIPEGVRLLLVEDDPILQIVILKMLKRIGVFPELASNGREALDRLAASHFDLVLMDCNMPEMDGLTACRAFRDQERALEAERHTPVIALTAFAMEVDRQACLSAGMDDFLSKPVRRHELHSALLKWLSKAPEESVET